ncbi:MULTISPECIES: CopL family metal-binding regulatory protein [unclassified Lysobacter]|uniref:CopL family metal-binding regulatory protein n=1 Tax=unclassified Lysobacter TaxID=2635362 RepID=UPI001C2345F3|nr:CopL family metal-binding regulatory protein [Lysobacter sp. MMG2]
MSHLVLRALLCLMLVLNGTGYTAAATQMGLAHLAMSAPGEQAATPPCHGESSHDEVAAMHAHADDDCATAGMDDGAPDCCQSSHCNCDCLQHATAAIAIFSVPAGLPPERHRAQPRQIDRPSPPLPHLLRPPIG